MTDPYSSIMQLERQRQDPSQLGVLAQQYGQAPGIQASPAQAPGTTTGEGQISQTSSPYLQALAAKYGDEWTTMGPQGVYGG